MKLKKIFTIYLVIAILLCGCGKDSASLNKARTIDSSSVVVNEEHHNASRRTNINSSGSREKHVKVKGNGSDTVTIMVYVNGSNLESDDSEATTDLSEMIAGAGQSDKINIVVQTMGTKKWDPKLGISAKETQRFLLDGSGLTKVSSNLGQLDCTDPNTLAEFIKWSAANYPADRYILLFWDHGAGSIYGFGYDQWVKDESACLTLDEMRTAFKSAGVYFDFIGMDCCIMATLETACAFYDYCDYSILCEDFESGLGWYYTDWISALYDNTSISTEELGTIICNDMILKNENDAWGDDAIMSVIDESNVKVLYQAWVDFAYANEDQLLKYNFSRAMKPKKGGRTHPLLSRGYYDEDYKLSDYYEVDIMAVASSIDSKESDTLRSAISNVIVYSIATKGDADLTGLAVTIPYGDSDAYRDLKVVFSRIGLDDEYISWLGKFVSAPGNNSYYNYDDFNDSWDGWDYYDDDYEWDDWNNQYDEEYWNDNCPGFDDFDYEDSYNCYYDEESKGYYFWDDYEDWLYFYDDEEDMWYYYDEDEDEWYSMDEEEWDESDNDWGYDDEDWYYDDELELWVYYDEEEDEIYLYDEDSDTLLYYDEDNDELYYYDEDDDEWYLLEE